MCTKFHLHALYSLRSGKVVIEKSHSRDRNANCTCIHFFEKCKEVPEAFSLVVVMEIK